MLYKQVNYNFLCNGTLKKIVLRKYKKRINYNYYAINMMFWYKQMPADEFNSMKLFDNVMLVWLIFNKKLILSSLKTAFKLNIHYRSAVLRAGIASKKEKFFFFDAFVNGVIPFMRRATITTRFVNNTLHMILSDMAYFSSTKIGNFFYVENVTDKIFFCFDEGIIETFEFLSLLKLNMHKGTFDGL